MSVENEKTVAIYEKYAREYLEGSVKRRAHQPGNADNKREWLKAFLQRATAGMPKDASFFEFGSANGDAVGLFAELGYELQPSDAPFSFVEIMREKGLSPVQFNILKDDFPRVYDGIYSWRTLVHFTKDDVKQIFTKVFGALKPGGRYIFSTLNSAAYGNIDDQWFDYGGDYRLGVDRYYNYWREDDLRRALEKAGFVIISLDKSGGENNNRWYNVVAEKPQKATQ